MAPVHADLVRPGTAEGRAAASTTWRRDHASASGRLGSLILLALYLSLLGGRFSFERLNTVDVGTYVDLRFVGLAVSWMLLLPWLSMARERTRPTSLTPYLAAFGVFCAWMLLTLGWTSPDAEVVAQAADLFYLFAFVTMALAVASRLSTRELELVWWWLLATALLYVVAALMTGPDPQGRYSALGGGPNVFVRVMTFGVLAAFVLALLRRATLVLVTVPLFVAGAVLSGSRGGLLALILVGLPAAAAVLMQLQTRLRRRVILAGLAGTGVATWAAGEVVARLWQQRYVVQTLAERYDSGRASLVGLSLDMVQEHPFAGAGLGAFHATHPEWAYPHNLVLGTAAEAGLVGVALLFVVLAVALVVVRQGTPWQPNTWFFALAAASVFLSAQFSGDLYDTRFLWFFLGLAVISARRQERRSRGLRDQRRSWPTRERTPS